MLRLHIVISVLAYLIKTQFNMSLELAGKKVDLVISPTAEQEGQHIYENTKNYRARVRQDHSCW